MTTTLDSVKTLVAELQRGNMHALADILARDLAKHESEHRALLADNAALARAGHWLEHERDAYHPMNCRCGVCERARDVFKQPHPGAALLSEMEALRKRVDDAEDAKRDAMSDIDSLRRRLSAETARAENAERERDAARAQLATARAAALEEAHAAAKAAEYDHDPTVTRRRSLEAISALATTPPPPVVPVAKVREVLRQRLSEADTPGERYVLPMVAGDLGINIDGEP